MKTCFKCGQIKPLDDFYRHPKMADGRLGKCKACTKVDVSMRETSLRSTEPTWILAERERCRIKQKARRKSGVKDNPDVVSKAKAKWCRINPHKRMAHSMVTRALRTGKLVRKPCTVCGCTQSEAHHEDYSKPLDVVWLCDIHHKETHNKKRENQTLESFSKV